MSTLTSGSLTFRTGAASKFQVDLRYANTAFEGVGSKKAEGRWNSPGRAVVYTSENRATAALEILVHVRRAQPLRDAYVIFKLDVPDELASVLDLRALPQGWDAPIETLASTDIGTLGSTRERRHPWRDQRAFQS